MFKLIILLLHVLPYFLIKRKGNLFAQVVGIIMLVLIVVFWVLVGLDILSEGGVSRFFSR